MKSTESEEAEGTKGAALVFRPPLRGFFGEGLVGEAAEFQLLPESSITCIISETQFLLFEGGGDHTELTILIYSSLAYWLKFLSRESSFIVLTISSISVPS